MLCDFILCVMVSALLQPTGQSVEQLTKELRAKDEKTRVQAAKRLAALGARAKRAIPALTEALRDEDEKVRLVAARALGRIGPGATSAVHALVEAYCREGTFPSEAMRCAILRIGKAAVPVLLREVRDKKSRLRRCAIRLLGEMGREAKPAIPTLTELLVDEKLSFFVARALVSIDPNHKKAIAILQKKMKEPADKYEKLEAAAALAVTKQRKQVVPYLIQQLSREKDPYITLGIAEFLWLVGPDAKAAVPALTKRLKETNPKADLLIVPLAAALLKIDPGNELARATLRQRLDVLGLLANSSWPLLAIDAIGRLGKDAKDMTPELEKLLNHDCPNVCSAARKALQAIRGDNK